MKKGFLFFALLNLSLFCLSQEIQLNPYAGYFLGGKLNGYEADAQFGGGPDFGLGLSYGLGGGKNIEVSYNVAASDVSFEGSGGIVPDNANMTFGYIQIGYAQDILLKNSDKDVRPFVLITMGAAYLNPSNDDYSTAWRYSTTLGGGLKYFFTDRIGIRVQARLLLPFFFSGSSIYCGTGGCGTSVNSFSSLAQGAFDGGLIFKFGE